MPSGIKALEIRCADEERAFKYIDKARYVINFTADSAPDCEGFLSMGEAVVTKKSKSGEKEENILPDIFSLNSRELLPRSRRPSPMHRSPWPILSAPL